MRTKVREYWRRRPNDKTQNVFNNIIEAMTGPLMYEEKVILLRALITQLVLEKRQTEDVSTTSTTTQSSLISRAMSYIDANLRSDLTIQKIAKNLYVSESTLAHKFRKELNISVYHYIIEKRLSVVRQYVISGYTISQAASLSGFNDYASFFRIIKSHYGQNPSLFLNLFNN